MWGQEAWSMPHTGAGGRCSDIRPRRSEKTPLIFSPNFSHFFCGFLSKNYGRKLRAELRAELRAYLLYGRIYGRNLGEAGIVFWGVPL